MSRLLFAAARGARIEQYRNVHGAWVPAEVLPASEGDSKSFRIHPDDAHLAYGPISTALREIARTGDYEDNTIPYFTFGIEREDNYWESTADQRRVFCLILAEALADSGL
jgi:hypothetical protein